MGETEMKLGCLCKFDGFAQKKANFSQTYFPDLVGWSRKEGWRCWGRSHCGTMVDVEAVAKHSPASCSCSVCVWATYSVRWCTFFLTSKSDLKIPFFTLHKNFNRFKLIFKCFLNLIFWLQQTLESFFNKNMDIFTSWRGCLSLRQGHVRPSQHMTVFTAITAVYLALTLLSVLTGFCPEFWLSFASYFILK